MHTVVQDLGIITATVRRAPVRTEVVLIVPVIELEKNSTVTNCPHPGQVHTVTTYLIDKRLDDKGSTQTSNGPRLCCYGSGKAEGKDDTKET